MAALVTLEVAKSHLRVTSEAEDDDIDRKVEQASAIILDYLKARANRPADIDSSSVASPTVITTDEAHGYTTGDTAVIADHEDSTPDINGSYVLTVISSTTFSIPVAVTVAGTGGTATVAWTPDTVTETVRTAVLLTLEDLHERRPIDWVSLTRLLERSRDPAFA